MEEILNVRCLMFLIKKATRCETEAGKYSEITKIFRSFRNYFVKNSSSQNYLFRNSKLYENSKKAFDTRMGLELMA
ncbi:CLUMA_CG000557, isoform A [Clunio marinus]|uniref:CLUMA_CG000557, isoform A n=1 Tax=Clunio marinus TaxID=568069 RepID=A0A1J1HH32_9DIPT|nr:CLUMA_CG000557, isoform A [Clunio marinus]